jgi:hypothetical protein
MTDRNRLTAKRGRIAFLHLNLHHTSKIAAKRHYQVKGQRKKVKG